MDAVFAIVPGSTRLLEGIRLDDDARVSLVGEGPIRWDRRDTGVEVAAAGASTVAIRLEPRGAVRNMRE